MHKELVILDFDGTFTRLEAEREHFEEQFFDRVRRKALLTTTEFEQLLEEQRKILRQAPHLHGWVHEGILVAGLVDQYIEMNVLGNMVFSAVGILGVWEDRFREIQSYFHEITRTLVSEFKSGAKEVFLEIMRAYPDTSYVVSNSRTEIVQKKLHELLGSSGALFVKRAEGSAKKYVVNPQFTDIDPEIAWIPGLDRPIHLRRQVYYEVINRLCNLHIIRWEDVWVFGDIAELDIMMPFMLGATVGLMDHKWVPEYERRYFGSQERARVLSHPEEILHVLGIT